LRFEKHYYDLVNLLVLRHEFIRSTNNRSTTNFTNEIH